MKHKITNKLKYALRHLGVFKQKVFKDKKKEAKKTGKYIKERSNV